MNNNYLDVKRFVIIVLKSILMSGVEKKGYGIKPFSASLLGYPGLLEVRSPETMLL